MYTLERMLLNTFLSQDLPMGVELHSPDGLHGCFPNSESISYSGRLIRNGSMLFLSLLNGLEGCYIIRKDRLAGAVTLGAYYTRLMSGA